MANLDDDTSPQSPKAKNRYNLHELSSLVNVIEYILRHDSEIRRQLYHLIIKFDRGDPVVYNQLADVMDSESRRILNEFRESVNELEDRPSQSIIVNVESKKETERPKNFIQKLIYSISLTIATIASIILALHEAGLLK